MVDTTSLGLRYPEATDNVNIWEHIQNLAEDVNAALLSRGRIATSLIDTDSATFTTGNTEIASVTAALVTGRKYRVRLITHIGSTTSDSTVSVNLREDNTAGVELQAAVSVPVPTTTAAGHYVEIEGEFTAVGTGNKTFVGVAARASGTGTLRREAAGTRPTLLYVDYAR